jgi:hypothetical protein
MAKEYLGLLERKGYIERRTDGYRKYFKPAFTIRDTKTASFNRCKPLYLKEI